jgi:hypothetical protein
MLRSFLLRRNASVSAALLFFSATCDYWVTSLDRKKFRDCDRENSKNILQKNLVTAARLKSGDKVAISFEKF